MPRNRSRFMEWACKFYGDYLNEQKTDGGWCEDYVTRGLKAITADPVATGASKAMLELAAKAMRGVWHEDPEHEQPELFTVAGNELEGTYTYADPHVPGKHRRVAVRWATPRQVERDALLAEAKAIEAVQAAQDKQKNAARIMAHINDPDALLWDYRDGPSRRPPADDRPTA